MSLNRFAEHDDIRLFLTTLLTAYELIQPDVCSWPLIEGKKMRMSANGEGVFFCDGIKLDENIFEIAEHTYSGDQLVINVTKCAAYFLQKNIAPEYVPHILKICFPIRHNEMQWTGIMAVFSGFKSAYTKIYKVWNDDTSVNKNFYDVINAVIDQDPKILTAREGGLPDPSWGAQVIDFFHTDKRLVITHFNSTGDHHLDSRTFESFHKIRGSLTFLDSTCSRQQGNTCGEHLVFNFFAQAVMNSNLQVNAPGSKITSQALRNLSYLISDNLGNPYIMASIRYFVDQMKKTNHLTASTRKTRANTLQRGFWNTFSMVAKASTAAIATSVMILAKVKKIRRQSKEGVARLTICLKPGLLKSISFKSGA